MQRRDLIGWSISALLFTLSSLTHAFIVTIEPDDYAAGTDLSNVSPYVTLSSRYYSSATGGAVDTTITAEAPNPGHLAPTGDLSFGYHGLHTFPGSIGDPAQLGGFALTFHQETSQLTLLANNSMYPGLSARWEAYDRNGNAIGGGSIHGGESGEAFLIDIQLDDLWAVIVGGEESISAINFDRLSFSVVPEPGTWMLLVPGLLALALRRQSPAA